MLNLVQTVVVSIYPGDYQNDISLVSVTDSETSRNWNSMKVSLIGK